MISTSSRSSRKLQREDGRWRRWRDTGRFIGGQEDRVGENSSMDAVAQSQTTPAEPGNCRVVVVMPAYNAVRTLMDTYNAIPPGLAKEVILVDDKSQDATVDLAKTLPIKVIKHPHNTGYGGSQKTLYMEALRD